MSEGTRGNGRGVPVVVGCLWFIIVNKGLGFSGAHHAPRD